MTVFGNVRVTASRRGHMRMIGLLFLAGVFTTAMAAAQPTGRIQATATVTTAAPVYLLPDETRKPLRVLAVGTTLMVLQVRGDWFEVTFADPQFGRRTGWVQRKFVRLNVAPPEEAAKPAPGQPTKAPPTKQPARKPIPRGPLGVRGLGTVAFDKLTATESFKTITEKDTTTLFGGGVQVINLWRGIFAEVAVETTSLNGERVFLGPDNEVFRLGIPVEITMRPVDVVAGWRSAPIERFTTYGGAGATFLSYEETSEFAVGNENVNQSQAGFVLLGGVEVRATTWVHVRGELRYRSIQNVIGVGGVSDVFAEDDLGGFGVALKIAVGR